MKKLIKTANKDIFYAEFPGRGFGIIISPAEVLAHLFHGRELRSQALITLENQ